MAKTTKKIDPIIPLLTIDKQILKAQIIEREQIGLELINRPIKSNDEKQQAWDEFMRWNTYNEELIKQAFNDPNNTYADQYKYRPGFDIGSVYARREKTFQERVENNKSEIRHQLKKLRSFYERVDLFKSESVLIPHSEDKKNDITQLVRLLNRFHKVAQALRHRHADRDTILIDDEYDVQDLLYGLLQNDFNDIRKEESSPSSAGANSRLDFVIKEKKVILEIKMTSEKYSTKKLGEDLLVDIGRYKAYPDCNQLVIFIYDKGDHIRNKHGFIVDLENQSTSGMKVTVIINPD